MTHTGCFCSVAPPDLLARLIEGDDPDLRAAALATMAASASMRTQRSIVGRLARELGQDPMSLAYVDPPPAHGLQQTVYDVEGGGRSSLPGKRVRGSGDPATSDEAVDGAYDTTEITYNFLKDAFGRDSLDGKGMELISSVHYSTKFDNAFWDGTQMVYGDGGKIFKPRSLPKCLSVTAHENGHGVTQHTAGLIYSKQPGALNEHFSDVFGALATQYSKKQAAADGDWLIGEDILVPSLGKALRSMKNPADPEVASRQPTKMAEYRDLPDDGDPHHDNGGVHINSGIPNRAFYLAATTIGGNAWEKAGKIWYQTLTGGYLSPTSDFKAAAEATVKVAGEVGSATDAEAVEAAWREVEVLS
jgi:Zn-dependent metalloprotease